MMNLPIEKFEEQKTAWKKYGLELCLTEDGSPTLREDQTMHHLGGALSETDYIYNELLREAQTTIKHPQCLVVGLGLGYIEHFIAFGFLSNPEWRRSGQILSYESREDLRQLFQTSLTGNISLKTSPEVATFVEVAELIRNHEKVQASSSSLLNELLTEGRFQLRSSLSLETLPSKKINMIFFDAYSSRSTPHLWDEKFFTKLFQETCEPTTLFSTYACTGVLTRALKEAGFAVMKRPGFKGKRESTFALRRAPE